MKQKLLLTVLLLIAAVYVNAQPNWSYTSTSAIYTIDVNPYGMYYEFPDNAQSGDYIGAFYDDNGSLQCAGYGIFTSSTSYFSFNAYGSVSGGPGFQLGDSIIIKLWNDTEELEYMPLYVEWDNWSTTFGTWAIGGYGSIATIESEPIAAATNLYVDIFVSSSINCAGDSTAGMYSIVMGGTPPYSYLWSNGSTDAMISNLPAGTYDLTVTDNTGSSGSTSVQVLDPLPMTVSALGSLPTCSSCTDGSILATVLNGTSPYYFEWSTGDFTVDGFLDSLGQGNYSLIVSDAMGCKSYDTINLNLPTPPIIIPANSDSIHYFPKDYFIVEGSDDYEFSHVITDEENNIIVSGYFYGTLNIGNETFYNTQNPDAFILKLDSNYTFQWAIQMESGGLIRVNALEIDDSNAIYVGTIYNGSSINILDTTIYKLGSDYSTMVFKLNEGGEMQWLEGASSTCDNFLNDIAYSNGALYVYQNFGEANTSLAGSLSFADTILSTSSGTYNDGRALFKLNASNGDLDWAKLGYDYWKTGGSLAIYDADHMYMSGAGYSLWADDTLSKGFVVQFNELGQFTNSIDSLTYNYYDAVYMEVGSDSSYYWYGSLFASHLHKYSLDHQSIWYKDMNYTLSDCRITDIYADDSAVFILGFSNYDSESRIDGFSLSGDSLWSDQHSMLFLNSICKDKHGDLLAVGSLIDVTIGFGYQSIVNSTYISSALALRYTEDHAIGYEIESPTCVGNNGSISFWWNQSYGSESDWEFVWSNGASSSNINSLSAGTYTLTYTPPGGDPQIETYQLGSDLIEISYTTTLPTCYSCNDGGIDITVSGGQSPYDFQWSNGIFTEDLINVTSGQYTLTVFDDNGCLNFFTVDLDYTDPEVDWEYNITDVSHTIYIPSDAQITLDNDPIQVGDVLGVFYDKNGLMECGGFATWNGGNLALTAWGNDTIASEKNGFDVNESFVWKIWQASSGVEFTGNVHYIPYPTMPNTEWFSVYGISGIDTISALSYQEQFIELISGWSMISTYIDPYDQNIQDVFQEIEPNLIIAKDYLGNAFWPLYSINTIGDLQIGDGYMLKMQQYDTLIVVGEKVNPILTEVLIPQGWSMLGYLRDNDGSVADLMSSIVNDIIILKNDIGQVYWPAFGVNTMGIMEPGEGYYIKMAVAQSIYYPANSTNTLQADFSIRLPQHYPLVKASGNNMTIGIPLEAWKNIPEYGDEIAVYSMSDQIVGTAVFTDNNMAITLWGDDALTLDKEGLVENEEFYLKYYSTSQDLEFTLQVDEWDDPDFSYEMNKINFIRDLHSQFISDNKTTLSNYPNPFTDETTIEFYLPGESKAEISIYSVSGEKVLSIANQKFSSGTHQIKVSDISISPGTYFCRIQTDSTSVEQKLVIIR